MPEGSLAGADRRIAVLETELRLHVSQCNARAAIAQKLLWFVATASLAMLGFLAKLALPG